MRSINLDQLRALETVIERASFTAAAKTLHLSQSTISVQIKELEKRFGVRLVDRLGKRAAPTPAGRELIEHARRLAESANLVDVAMRRHREGSLGQVRIGATTTALNYYLAPVLRRMRREHPSIELAITWDTTQGQIARMVRDEIDFGLMNLPVRERVLVADPLRTEQLMAIFPRDTKNVPRVVTPDYLAQHTLILEAAGAFVRGQVMEWLAPAAGHLGPTMQLDNSDSISRMVAVGLGASVVPESVLAEDWRRKDLIVRPLRPRLERTLGLVVHKDKVLDRAMRIFRAAMLDAHAGSRRRRKRSGGGLI